MAKSTIAEFLIKVGSVGLGKAKKDVDDLGKSTQNVGKAHDVADKSARQHFDTQAKGVIGTANSTRSFSKLAQTMNSGGGVVGAYATLAANVFAVSAAFNALRGASQVDQIFRGLEASGTRLGQTLTVTASGLKEVTKNAISTEQALRSTAQITAAGFGAKEVEALGKAARDTSFALGRNLTDSLDRLTRGVVKLEPELLDELGIMTKLGESNAAFAAKLGKTESALTSFEKRQGFLNAVLTEADLKFGGLADSAGDSTNYDKLASSLNDLKNTVLSFINVAAVPLAGLFSNSQGALLGGALLFASTIRSQLLPGLSDLSKKSAELAKSQQVKVKKENENILDSEANPKVIEGFQRRIKNGTADLDAYKKALADVEAEIVNVSSRVAKFDARGEENSSKSQIATYKKNTEALIDLRDVHGEVNEVIRATEQVRIHENAANAITAAGQGKLKTSLSLLGESYRGYKEELKASTDSSKRSVAAMNSIKAASYATSVGVKALGAAFLNFIPVLGQIIFFGGLAVAALQGLRSESEKKYGKELKELVTITSSMSDKMRELERINGSNATTALRAEKAIVLQANAINELVDKYKEVEAAATAAKDAENKPNSGVANFLDSLGRGGSATASFALKIREDSEALKLFKDEIQAGTFGVYGMEKGTKELVVTLDALAQTDAGKEVIKLHGGFEALSKLPLAQKAKEIKAIIDEVKNRAGGAAQLVQSLTMGLKDLDTAIGAFFRSAVQSTPYDDMVNKFTSVTQSMAELEIAMADGQSVAGRWKEVLQGIGPELSRMLNPDISRFVSNQNTIETLQQVKAESGSLNKIQEQLLDRATEANKQSGLTLSNVQESIIAARQKVVVAQDEARINKSVVQLAQATLAANQENYAISALGVGKQIDAQNKIKDLQISSLRAQKAVLSTAIEANKANLERLKADYERLKVSKDDLIVEKKKLQVIRQQEIAAIEASPKNENTAYEEVKFNNLMKLRYDYAATENDLKATANSYDADALRYANDQRNIQESIRGLTASQAALENEINSILIDKVSNAEKLARINLKQVEINNANRTALDASKVKLEEMVNMDARRAEFAERGRISFAAELNMQVRSNNNAQARLKTDSDSRIASLKAQQEVARTSGNDLAVRNAAVKVYQDQIDIEEASLRVNQAHLTSTQNLAILEQVIFDTREQGIQWQKDALSYTEKQLSVENDLRSSILDRANAENALSRKRRGYGDSTANTQTEEIRSAQAAYESAVREANVKKTLIDLEYALLDAQRVSLMEELRVRRTLLSADNKNGEFDTQIAQLDSVVTSLSNVNVTAIARTAKAAVDESIGGLRTGLITALTTAGAATNSAFADFNRLRQTRASAEASIINSAPTAVAGIIAGKIAPEINPLVASNDNLSTNIVELNNTINELMERTAQVATTTSTVTMSARERAAEAGRYAQSQGLSAWQQPDLGNGAVGGHSRGSLHYSGQAVDIYSKPGKGESTDPREKARYDKLAAYYRSQGATVYWQVKGHFDHMHVEFAEGIQRTVETVQKVASVGLNKLDEVTDLGSVTVTGKRVSNDVLNQAKVPELNNNITARIPNIGEKTKVGLEDYIRLASSATDMTAGLRAGFEALGPEGAAVLAAVDGISAMGNAMQTVNNVFADKKATNTDKFVAMAAVAQSALSTISSVYAQASAAKIAGIDAEIAAEQKRDGKSAESVAKLQALERKKDAVAKKAFDTNKKLMMAQAIIATATGIAQAMTLPSPMNFIMAGVIGALGAAQLGIIAGTSYQSTSAPATQSATLPNLSIGKRGDSVDLAKNNPNAGGEIGYLRGAQGRGNNASNYSVIGSAYGGKLNRGYGNSAYIVGEHGPEVMTPDAPMSIRPMADTESARGPTSVQFNVQALDAKGVEEILMGQRGNIIGMLREAANANGQTFLENINTAVYTKPNVGRL